MVLPKQIICDRYQLTKQLSNKAGRSTYLAQDLQGGGQVVIKILEFNEIFTWDDLKLFEREAQTLKNISHSNIPDYLDYFEIDTPKSQGFALVQSYITAPSLEELISQGIKFTELEIIDLAKKLLKILNYLHQLNPPIIHRDIKPSNILLNNRSGNSIGDVYIVDFGSVQTVAKKEAGTITIVGSYGYIPLEQFMGKTTFASDLYSLGMTLIYLVSGIHPANLTQSTGKVKFDSRNISLGFTRWLGTITEPYIDKRYTSAEIALKALQFKENNKTISYYKYYKSDDFVLNLSPDSQTLEIIYVDSHIYPGCLVGLVIFFPISIYFSVGWGFVVAFIFIFLGNAIFPPKPKYRVISLNTNKKVREGFYVEDRKNLEWINSCILPIEELIYSPSYTFSKCLDTQKNLIPGAKVTVDAKLSLVAGHEEICIHERKTKKTIISNKDLWRLGNKVSNFLDLELEVISQTPIIPNSCN